MLRVTTRIIGVTGAPYYNNLFFGGSTLTEAQAAHAAAAAFWQSLGGDLTTAAEGHVEPDVAQIDPATGLQTGNYVVPEVVVDFAGGAVLPWTTQGLLQLRTGQFVNGRELRGRIYVPAVPSEYNSGGAPSVAYIGQLNTAAAALLAGQAPAGGLVVYSRTHKIARAVTNINAWNQFAELRTRRD